MREIRDRIDPMKKVRKPVPKPDIIIHGPKYNKGKMRKEEQKIIQDGLIDYEKEENDGQ